MERLTYKKGNHYYTKDPWIVEIRSISDNGHLEVLTNCLDKLGAYEDAEEQGLLLRLQFKIGQKVYYIYKSCIDKSLMIGSMIYSYSCLDFPREYFATKEEAEQALKQMEN